MERVLIVGSTGNIGVAATIAALRTKRSVLAIVRNQASAEKLFKHVGTKEGIETVEADVTSENGVQGVVDQVNAGKLPSFQHVYATVGFMKPTPMHEVDVDTFRHVMKLSWEANFWAYRATIPYLLQQSDQNSTWTMCTGAAGEVGVLGITGVTQGALYSMINVAIRENMKTNIRINEAYLATRVEYDSEAESHGVMRASEYAGIYEAILSKPEIDGCRVTLTSAKDLKELNYKKKLG